MRLNCSNRFRGRKVMREYFDVMTWFEGYTCSLLTFPLTSKKLPGKDWLTKTVLGGPGIRLPEKRSSTLKATRRAYQFERRDVALVSMAINGGIREAAPGSTHMSAAIIKKAWHGGHAMRQGRNPGNFESNQPPESGFDSHRFFVVIDVLPVPSPWGSQMVSSMLKWHWGSLSRQQVEQRRWELRDGTIRG